MVGLKFGKYTVVREVAQDKYGARYYACECECGDKRILNGHRLRTLSVADCKKCNPDSNNKQTHGMSSTPTYSTWSSTLSRARFRTCDRWQKFENFYEDMGERPSGYFLCRRDTNIGFNKENCFWAPYKALAYLDGGKITSDAPVAAEVKVPAPLGQQLDQSESALKQKEICVTKQLEEIRAQLEKVSEARQLFKHLESFIQF